MRCGSTPWHDDHVAMALHAIDRSVTAWLVSVVCQAKYAGDDVSKVSREMVEQKV